MKKILLISCVTIFICSCIFIIQWDQDNKHTKEVLSTLNNGIIPGEKNVIIDFDYLLKQNKDTIGWITVNNTNIDYPIVQTKNNKYYLNHAFDKKYTDAGWIFMDYRNDFLNDQNTIIYGHDRKDNSMFGTLKNTLKKDWYNDKTNHIITIYTKDNIYNFQVFSTYHIKTEDYYVTPNFTKEEYKKFLKTILKRSTHNYKVKLDENNKILTLSTCYTKNEKLVLHAVLVF